MLKDPQAKAESDFHSLLSCNSDEFSSSNNSHGVKGRLSASVNYWVEPLNASDFVLDIIRRGYRLPFHDYPSPCHLRNNKSSLQHREFVSQAITELLSNACIIEHATPPFCVNPLTVAEGKKLRLVIDLRHVNEYLVKPKFKYEDLRSLSEVLDEGHWFFTWDLRSGYHHVDICSEHQQYLGFAWLFDGVLRYFTFTVLPFGLSSACFCFTKLMRPLVTRWRSMGHNSFIYLDDGFGSRPDKRSAKAASLIQQKELASSGLCCNEEKSHWSPVQIGEWLGLLINTIAFNFQIPNKKVNKLKSILDSALLVGSSSYRELARIAGSIISVALAVGPISRLFTRQMYFAIESRTASWDHLFHFPPSLLEELRFWRCNIDSFNGYALRPPVASSTVVFTDASGFAFGGFSASLDGAVVSAMWTAEDIGQSSTFRELKAIYYVLLSYADQLKCKRVRVYTDNQSAARIVSVGSSKVHLQTLALDIFQLCFSNSIVLEAQWIPRSLNGKADLLSRFIDRDDWSINPSVFRVIDAKWGPHTIDRFSAYYNSQLPRFNSKFASPGGSGIDALVQDWSEENNWICPPVSLIVSSVRMLMSVSGHGTLIIPEWPSSYFWPYLHNGSSGLKPFVKEVFVLPNISDLLLEGPGQRQIYKSRPSVFCGCPKFRMLALRLDFRLACWPSWCHYSVSRHLFSIIIS